MGGRRNLDLRISARMAGIPLWRIAETMGISEMTLYRKLNKNLSDDERTEIMTAIRKNQAGMTDLQS